MVAPVFREPAFVWACVLLASVCALAALAVWQRKFLLGLSERFFKLPPSSKAVIVTAVVIATVFAQKPTNVSTNQHESARIDVEVSATPIEEPTAFNTEEAEGGRHGDGNDVLDRIDSDRAGSSNPVNPVNPVKETPCHPSSASSALSVADTSPLSSNDVVRGYRLETVRTNATDSFERPADARLVGTWHLTDAYRGRAWVMLGEEGEGKREEGRSAEDRSSVAEAEAVGQHGKADGSALLPSSLFRFPLGRHAVTSLWAHTWGKVRPQLRNASNEIVVVGAPMFARHDLSYLWTAATTNGSVVLTWENFFLGNPYERSAANLHESTRIPIRENPCQSVAHPSITAQLELFPNGDFIARSNDVERVYRRVNPDDWDDDGIPNGEDTEPFAPADVPQFGPHQTLPEGADTNHYYWIDLVVPHANARVAFEGDGDSDLPDPDFIARADETNRVALLIGKAYCVRSTLPFAVVGRESPEVEVLREGGGLTVRWPLQIDYVDVASVRPSGAARQTRVAGSGGTTMRIRPPRAKGGTYSWPGRFCCYTLEADGTPVFSCDGACGCGGCSTGDVVYRFAGYEFTLGGWSCGCSHVSPDEPLRPGDGEEETQPTSASVSVRFTKNAVIFENEHEQSPGVKVPRRSTRTTLVCSASGGPNGGVVRFEATGDSRILRISGRELPFEQRLEAGESFEEEIVYEGRKGWSSGVKVTGTFTDDNPDAQIPESVARLNVAEVEISVLNFAPGNECFYRHKFGICETICCNVNPMGVPLRWEASDGGTVNSDGRYRCPSIPAVNTLKAICGDAEFIPNITVVEPDGIEARNPQCYPYKVSAGRAGWIGLKQEFYVKPLDVSFVGIAMEEVPSTAGRRSGYFARPGFDVIGCHSKAMGAGEWMPIDRDNKMGKYDVASISLELLRVNADGDLTDNPDFGWEDGWITWEVPFGWASAELADKDKNTPPLKVFDPQAGHRFEITPSGLVTVRKFGNSAQREADGRMYCNGIEWRKDE